MVLRQHHHNISRQLANHCWCCAASQSLLDPVKSVPQPRVANDSVNDFSISKIRIIAMWESVWVENKTRILVPCDCEWLC